VEALLGNVAEMLLATVEQQQAINGEDHEEAPCPAIVGMLIYGKEEYAKVLMGGDTHTRDQTRAAFEGIQWIADRRKTKADSEERSLQEKLTRILRGLKEMILLDGDAEEWKRRVWSFGEAMKDFIWFVETVDIGVDVGNYPRVMYQGSLEPGRHKPRQAKENTGNQEVEEEGARGGTRATGTQPTRRQEGRTGDGHTADDGTRQRLRQFPEAPRTRRPNPDDRAYGGWDMIDHLTVDQCANMPPRIHTVEVIPNSLQVEWTEAWNAVHRMRHAARTYEENEMALKWILWLPQGLLHAPQRARREEWGEAM
jgi:hypothetical protein